MRNYFLLIIALGISLFIYVFFRTDKTLVNQLVLLMVSSDTFHYVVQTVRSAVTLPEPIIYSLPEGLWVFCITLTSSPFQITISKKKLPLKYIPLIYAVVLELCQLLHITNGRFDWMDIIFSTIFWLLALKISDSKPGTLNIFHKFRLNEATLVGSYGIVYLAHVLQ